MSQRYENITVKSKKKLKAFWSRHDYYFRWGQIYVMNLNSGKEYYFCDGEGSRAEAQQWIFDPLLRAIKVAELNKKHKRLTKLNKVVKLAKPKQKVKKNE